MQASLLAFILAVLASATSADPEPLSHLDEQLATIGGDTALVYPSQAVDEYPLWSPDARFLAVNIEGVWKRIDLTRMELASGTWRGGQLLGVPKDSSAVADASEREIEEWQKSNKMQPRKAVAGHTIVELRQNELSTELVVTRPPRKSESRWSTDMENCHSLVVSPRGRHVAFICEMNGVFILKVAG